MEFDDDTHLCLRCSRTVIGLDNYVSHRQQHCCDYQQSLTIPLLLENPEGPPSVDNLVRNSSPAHSPISCQDIGQLRASDFFSYLELQSTKTDHSCNGISCDKISKENFCTPLEPMTFDHDLNSNFVHDKHPCVGDALHVQAENTMEDISSLSLGNDKWVTTNFGDDGLLSQCTVKINNKTSNLQDIANQVNISIADFVLPSNEIESLSCVSNFQSKPLNEEDSQLVEVCNSLPKDVCSGQSDKGIVESEFNDTDHNLNEFHAQKHLMHNEAVPMNSPQNVSNKQANKNHSQYTAVEKTSCDEVASEKISKHQKPKSHIHSFKKGKHKNNPPNVVSPQITNRCGALKFPELHEKFFRCTFCSSEFACPYAFTKHLLCNHKNSTKGDWFEEICRNEMLLVHTSRFQCLVCSYYFNDAHYLLLHIKSVKHRQNAARLKKTLICLPCQEECTASDELILHVSKVHLKNNREHPVIIAELKKNFYCRFCIFSCRDILSDLNKKVAETDNTVIENFNSSSAKQLLLLFDSCSFGFDISVMLHKIQLHLQKGGTTCGMVGDNNVDQNVPSQPDLNPITESSVSVKSNSDPLTLKNDEIMNKTTTPKTSCPVCLKYFDKKLMKVHSLCHNQFKCTVCDRVYPSKHSLKYHIRSHENLGTVQCQECDFETTRKGTFFRHIKIHNPKRTRSFVCETCGSAQYSKSALKQHMQSHLTPTFKCDYDQCWFRTYSENLLLIHEKRHSSERPYLCDKCDYAGKLIHQLKKHQRSHTGEKPFKCKLCNYSACLSSQLLRHSRVHTGSKPYKCPYCDYTSNTQENLRKHILQTKKHEGKKMYPCQHCDFDCNVFSEYKDHLLSEHSENFPNMDKDVNSSAIAGLYTKDNEKPSQRE